MASSAFLAVPSAYAIRPLTSTCKTLPRARAFGHPRSYQPRLRQFISASVQPTGESASTSTRRVVGFVYPWVLLWLSNQQLPVGDVPDKRSDEEWKSVLSPEAYNVLVKRGTERAGSSPLDKLYAPGTYSCAACDSPLFSSETKFNSGTGWPSFFDPLPGQVDLTLQLMYCLGDFGAREVRCHNCGGHLGHMFTDGPQPTGQRYCMNGVSLNFKAAEE